MNNTARKMLALTVLASGMTGGANPAYALTLNEVQKLLASDEAEYKTFGSSVAVDGDTAVIGATGDGSNGLSSGAAYVFTRDSSGTWNQQAKLLAGDGGAYDLFGGSVALSGNTAVIGAINHDDSGLDAGAAYVYTRDASGTWSQQAKLLASDGAASDYFGAAVALFADTAVIGAPDADVNGAANAGAAYVFMRNSSGVWSQQAKLTASDGAASDLFAESVTISGDTTLIGAAFDDDQGGDSGSAYVFTRNSSGVWSQQTKLQASDGHSSNYFGTSLSLDGNTALIGAYQDNVSRGAAYIFSRDSSNNWSQQAKLVAGDAASGDLFGFSVALSGATAVIGAYGAQDNGWFSGSAYVFARDSSGSWSEYAKLLAGDGAAEDYFGQSVAVSGDKAVVGALGADPNDTTVAGAAYVFSLAITPEQQLNNLIAQVQTLVDDNQGINGLLGPLTGLNLTNPSAAVHQLETFIKQVEMYVQKGWLEQTEGIELAAAANQLIQTIQPS